MLEKFYPTECAESVYDVDFKTLFQRGIRGLIFDIDNTLVPHGAPSDGRSRELFARLHAMGFQTCLLSNNRKTRVKPFAGDVDSMYIDNAHKPSSVSYEKAMAMMHTGRSTTVFIGDQIFTDIYGANRTGIANILVRPIHPREEIQIVLKRYLERVVLYFYRKSGGKVRKR